MRKALLSLLLAATAWGADSLSLDKELEPFKPFLGVWRGELSMDKNSPGAKPIVDIAKYERALNGKAIRVTHSINDGMYGGESLIVWNAVSKRLESHYFTTAGFRTEGTLEILADGAISSLEVVKDQAAAPDSDPIQQVRAKIKAQPGGGFKITSEYLTKKGWGAGRETLYKTAPDAQPVFK